MPPALVVGAGSGLMFAAAGGAAEALEDVWWDVLPDALGVTSDAAWWIVLVLTLTGLLCGLVVAFAPGHAGPDPATEGLVATPMPVYVVPGLLLALILSLAGGVSLGPENPIVAANVALACWLGLRLVRNPHEGPAERLLPGFTVLAVSGTIGAMFGSPVAAALILSELTAGQSAEPLWDRLFAPLVSAVAGAFAIHLVASPAFAVDLPPYPGFETFDLLTAMLVAVAGAVVGLLLVYGLPPVHAALHRVPNQVLRFVLGGLLLGLLGAVGGMITLFKGLEQTEQLVDGAATYTTWALVGLLVVKCLALLVAAGSSFRGGRIFPTVFIGAAVGLIGTRVFDGMPLGLAVGAGVLGVVLAITQQGWLSLFLAVAFVGDAATIPLLCAAVLPAWLVVTGHPAMQVRESPEVTS